jgi:hypothetical protein
MFNSSEEGAKNLGGQINDHRVHMQQLIAKAIENNNNPDATSIIIAEVDNLYREISRRTTLIALAWSDAKGSYAQECGIDTEGERYPKDYQEFKRNRKV